MKLSIVIVTWNSAGEITALLDSVVEHLGADVEVVIVDNGSSDRTVELVREHAANVLVIESSENLGFGGGNNVGVERATGDVVVLLNPDTYLVDDSLRRLGDLAVSSSPALFGPRVLNADGSWQPSASPAPAGVAALLNAFVPVPALPRLVREHIAPWRATRARRVGWLTGACVAARREILLELGPFDPRIHLYSEDLDLGLRASAAGIPSEFVPEVATIVHLEDRSSAQAFSDRGLWLTARNRRLVVHVRLGHVRGWIDFALEIVGHALAYAYRRLRRRDATYYRAWLALVPRLVKSDAYRALPPQPPRARA